MTSTKLKYPIRFLFLLLQRRLSLNMHRGIPSIFDRTILISVQSKIPLFRLTIRDSLRGSRSKGKGKGIRAQDHAPPSRFPRA